MNLSRATFAGLACAALLTLAACGGEDAATTTAASPSPAVTPSTTTVASPSASASSAPSPSAAVATMSDKKLCESAKKASDEMKAELVAIVGSGKEPSSADFKKILTGLEQKVTTLAAAGGDSKVAAALTKFGAEATKAAAAADPAQAADNPAFEKAGADITAACKKAGVSIIF
ncbi:hypothetical protein [Micromonospora sp. NPDC047074]|uniref:hypothetical protein n=1 Tax=Micromonospora sp. NPDC047074 TaxID=3154339 RepID=UPI0033C7EB56